MTEAYPPQDVWLWPIVLGDDQAAIRIDEDGAAFTASLTASSALADTAAYWATATEADYVPTGGTASTDVVVPGRLGVRSLYEELAERLTDLSPGGLTYLVRAAGPTESDLAGAGLKITTQAEATPIQILWSAAATTLPPQLLGWPASAGDTASLRTLTSPHTRWGCWQPPVGCYERRGVPRRRAFADGEHPTEGTPWTWEPQWVQRTYEYFKVGAQHVYRAPRASSTEYTRQGLSPDDRSNAAEDLWRYAAIGREPHCFVVVCPSTDGTEAPLAGPEGLEVARLRSGLREAFDPMGEQGQSSRQGKMAGEQYSPTLQLAALAPGQIADQWTVYRH